MICDLCPAIGDPERAAAVLRCLAAAERLPPINMGEMCSSFLRSAEDLPALQEAAVALALQHPDTPGTGKFHDNGHRQAEVSSVLHIADKSTIAEYAGWRQWQCMYADMSSMLGGPGVEHRQLFMSCCMQVLSSTLFLSRAALCLWRCARACNCQRDSAVL